MKNQQIRLEGAYNHPIFDLAKANGVSSVTLDFRPRSFNFLPIQSCLELLEVWGSEFENFRILFGEDSELVVQEIYTKIDKALNKKITLEFENYRENFNYKVVGLPYFLQVEKFEDIEKSLLQPLLKGYILNSNFLKELNEQNKLSKYLTKIKNLMISNQRSDIEIELKISWDFELQMDISRWFKVSHYILSISSEVEERYRTIHQTKLQNKLQDIQFELER